MQSARGQDAHAPDSQGAPPTPAHPASAPTARAAPPTAPTAGAAGVPAAMASGAEGTGGSSGCGVVVLLQLRNLMVVVPAASAGKKGLVKRAVQHEALVVHMKELQVSMCSFVRLGRLVEAHACLQIPSCSPVAVALL